MKALVSGATGFIGSTLVRELLKDGREVRALIRKSSDTRSIDGLDVEKAFGDIRDGDSVKAALQGCDTFYQAAALYEVWGHSRQDYYDVNVEGTRIALEAAMEQGVQKVVYTSSVATLGGHGKEHPADETAQFNVQKTGPDYYTTKYLGELEALKMAQKGLPVVIVNPTVVIGVRDARPTPSGRMILDVANQKSPGYMDGGWNFVDVEDVARGHILAAQKGKAGEKYILGNANMTLQEFYKVVAGVCGVQPPGLKFPFAAVLGTSYLYMLMAAITRQPPVVTPSIARMNRMYWYFDSSKAVRELGFPQTPVRDTVEKAVNWFRQAGFIKG